MAHHQHVALIELTDDTAQLRTVGLVPRAVSLKTFSAPVARNCFTYASTLWPSVETRASEVHGKA